MPAATFPRTARRVSETFPLTADALGRRAAPRPPSRPPRPPADDDLDDVVDLSVETPRAERRASLRSRAREKRRSRVVERTAAGDVEVLDPDDAPADFRARAVTFDSARKLPHGGVTLS